MSSTAPPLSVAPGPLAHVRKLLLAFTTAYSALML
jgi:hypothetical protein